MGGTKGEELGSSSVFSVLGPKLETTPERGGGVGGGDGGGGGVALAATTGATAEGALLKCLQEDALHAGIPPQLVSPSPNTPTPQHTTEHATEQPTQQQAATTKQTALPPKPPFATTTGWRVWGGGMRRHSI